MSTMYALCLCLFEGSLWNAPGMYHSSLTAQYSLICTFDPIEESISVRFASCAKPSTINTGCYYNFALWPRLFLSFCHDVPISLRKLEPTTSNRFRDT